MKKGFFGQVRCAARCHIGSKKSLQGPRFKVRRQVVLIIASIIEPLRSSIYSVHELSPEWKMPSLKICWSRLRPTGPGLGPLCLYGSGICFPSRWRWTKKTIRQVTFSTPVPPQIVLSNTSARTGDSGWLLELLSAHKDLVSITDPNANTPLHFASANGHNGPSSSPRTK